MSKRRWRNHSPAFKAKVAFAAVESEKALAGLAQQLDVHPNLISRWRAKLLESTADVLGAAASTPEPAIDVAVGRWTRYTSPAASRSGMITRRRSTQRDRCGGRALAVTAR